MWFVAAVILLRLAGHVLLWVERRRAQPIFAALADLTILAALVSGGFFRPLGIA